MRKIITIIFILLFSLLMFEPVLYAKEGFPVNSTGFGLESSGSDSWASFSIYDNFKNYLHNIKEETFAAEKQEQTLKPDEMVTVFVLDLVLSGLCLWFSMWILFKSPKLVLRAYLWFILILNFTWAIIMIIFRGVWKALNFLVITQQPDIEATVLDKFATIMLISAVIIFIWLMARSFNLHFFGTLEAFFVSQAAYFILIFIITVSISSSQEGILKVAKTNLGLRQSIGTYFSEIHSVAYGKSIFNLQRMRTFHL